MGTIYNHLTQASRDRIVALRRTGHSNRDIAAVLGVHHTTIGRECRRNRYGQDARTPVVKQSTYDATAAHHKAYVRRKYAKYQGKKIHDNPRLESFIVTNVRLDWNPDEMSGYLKLHSSRLGFYASKTTIYKWFDSVHGQPYKQYLKQRRRHPKKQNKNTPRIMIPNRVGIEQRPAAVASRYEAGHGEFDSVVSSKQSSSTAALAVVQERTTRLVRASLVPNLKPAGYAEAIVALAHGLRLKTLTTDNGIENRQWQRITNSIGTPVYFTDPYSSWQKGGVENANRMLRHYFPKGTDFSQITQLEVDRAVRRINKKPRRCLGYKTALQCAKEEGVLR